MQDEDERESQERQSLLAGMPQEMQDMLDAGLHRALREELDTQGQNQASVDLHYYHCDHLGMPLALTDREGRIGWAGRLDAWGNFKEEHNPQHMEQSIRLPGQHHDGETGLSYSRHRYYDPTVGSYINQDPIGLKGGFREGLHKSVLDVLVELTR